jgi:transcriptional regulator NrdR family protein
VTTYERVVADQLWVRKRDGHRQRFEPAKLRASLAGAAHKRPVSGDDLDALVDGVNAELGRAGGELSSERIVDLCLGGLDELDHGAYLQYLGTLEPTASDGDGKPRDPAISGDPARTGSVRAAREHA